jgi:predicted MarR family transcription regulator
VLHIIGRASDPRKTADICFVMNVEDTHIVTYAVKKLVKAGLVKSIRSGKDAFFTITEAGGEKMMAFAEVKRKLLVDAMEKFAEQETSMEDLAEKMRRLAAIYEQAARRAEIELS